MSSRDADGTRSQSAPKVDRRRLLQGVVGGAAGLAVGAGAVVAKAEPYKIKHDRIKQSIVPWCYKPLTVAQLAKLGLELGYKSIELCPPTEWPMLKEMGLRCAIAGSHGFKVGFAHPEEHDPCIKTLRDQIDRCAAHDVPSVITFSGFRRKLTTEDAVKNMVAGLKKIVGYAEDKKVTLCLEMLNSRVDVEMKGHPDYFCDDMDLTIDILKQIGSPRAKVLFDIYHVQIMQGDVIKRIRDYHEFIGHYHTAGNPGRAEIGDTQEINYPGIMRAIVETKYEGYVGQEFIPVGDIAASLADAARLCDV